MCLVTIMPFHSLGHRFSFTLCLQFFSRSSQHLAELQGSIYLCLDLPHSQTTVGNVKHLEVSHGGNGFPLSFASHLLPQPGSFWPNDILHSAGWSLHRAHPGDNHSSGKVANFLRLRGISHSGMKERHVFSSQVRKIIKTRKNSNAGRTIRATPNMNPECKRVQFRLGIHDT